MWFVAIAFVLIAGVSLAQITTMGVGGGAAGDPGLCGNDLDFTQTCNSQYIGAVM